jgi:hypothetical protein
MSLRDPEFCESLEGFVSTSELTQDKQLPKHQVCLHQTMPRVRPLTYSILANARCIHAVNIYPEFYLIEY